MKTPTPTQVNTMVFFSPPQNKGLLVMLHSETSIITENVTWKTFLSNESLSHRLSFRILKAQCSV